MMKDGGAAFPCATYYYEDGKEYIDERFPGLTKRQWYKGMALKSGMCPHNAYDIHAIASWSGAIADAELAEDAAREGEDG